MLSSKKHSWISKPNSKPLQKIIKLQFKTLKPSSTDLLTSNLVNLLDLFPVTLNQTQKEHNSKAYQPPQSQNEHVNVIFTRSGKSYNPPVNPNDQQNDFGNPINFDSDEEKEEPTPQPKLVKETLLPKPYKPKIPIDVIDEILEEDFNALLDEGSKITLPEEEIFAKFDKFRAMTADENSNSESDTEDPPHKQAFAWKTTDIPGICPSFCKHKIQLLDDKKPFV
ncbi:hypothetical protein Tco_0711338 [Tanacetum coccineum]